MSNLYKMELPEAVQLGLQHTRNSLAIASLLKSLQIPQSTERFPLSSDCQSRKKVGTSGESLGSKSAKDSWIFSTSDEYLAMLDKAGVIPMIRTYKINDYSRSWAD